MKPNRNETGMTRYKQPGQITRREQDALSLDETMQLGQVFCQSGFFQDSKDQAQSVVKILAGRELGLPPITAMTSINVIKNRVTLSAQAMGAIIKGSGEYDYRVKLLTDKECVLTFYQRGEKIGESSFSMEDAKKAGLTGDNWRKYPRNMLMARAISNGARWYCPHLISGAYTPDEMGARVDSMGEVVDVPQVHPTAAPIYEPPPEPSRHNGRPVGAPDLIEKGAVSGNWKQIHAIAREVGINHDQLHKLFNCASLKDLDAETLNSIPAALEGWAEQDRGSGMEKELTLLRRDLDAASSLEDMASRWKLWLANTKDYLTPISTIKATAIKEELKAAWENAEVETLEYSIEHPKARHDLP